MSGSAFAVTAGTNTPAPAAAAADTQEDTTSADTAGNDANTTPAETDENPYAAIARANVFQLKEPPPPPKRDDPAILNLPKVNITGFRKREGEPLRALFATVPKDPKEPAKYFNLTEGEKEDILEVKHIDPSQEFVDVIIAGTPTTLTVKSNSFVQPIVVPKNGISGGPGNPGIVARPPQPMAPPIATPGVPVGAAPPAVPAYNNQGGGGVIVAGGGGNTAIPGATVTSYGNNQPNVPNPAYNNPNAPAPGTVAPNGNDTSALRSIPTRIPPRDVRTPNYAPGGYPNQ